MSQNSEEKKQLWLIVNEKGEREWVDKMPIWRVNPYTGEELTIGYLPDGRKVNRPKKYKKSQAKIIKEQKRYNTLVDAIREQIESSVFHVWDYKTLQSLKRFLDKRRK